MTDKKDEGVEIRLATDEEQIEALAKVLDIPVEALQQSPWQQLKEYLADRALAQHNTAPSLRGWEPLPHTAVYAAPFPLDGSPIDWQEELEPGVETVPVPESGGRVSRVVKHTNIPGGVLMDTRKFEKWVLESYVPLQDLIVALEGRVSQMMVRLSKLSSENLTLKSQVSRLEQLVRELKAGKE